MSYAGIARVIVRHGVVETEVVITDKVVTTCDLVAWTKPATEVGMEVVDTSVNAKSYSSDFVPHINARLRTFRF